MSNYILHPTVRVGQVIFDKKTLNTEQVNPITLLHWQQQLTLYPHRYELWG